METTAGTGRPVVTDSPPLRVGARSRSPAFTRRFHQGSGEAGSSGGASRHQVWKRSSGVSRNRPSDAVAPGSLVRVYLPHDIGVEFDAVEAGFEAGCRHDLRQHLFAAVTDAFLIRGSAASPEDAEVIIPRPPTGTTRRRPNRSRTFSTCAESIFGSAVFPSNPSTATGHPSSEPGTPNTTCRVRRLPSRL